MPVAIAPAEQKKPPELARRLLAHGDRREGNSFAAAAFDTLRQRALSARRCQ